MRVYAKGGKMQIVIDIAKRKWESIQDGMYGGLLDTEMYQAIKNGTVLPENHGRLIDADNLFTWFDGECKTKYPIKDGNQYQTIMMYEVFDEIDDAPTILEASERGKE